MDKNRLYFGDNLDIMKDLYREYPHGLIDLIYIDPPFNSKRNYNILFEDIAEKLGASFNGECVTLEIPVIKLKEACRDLFPLLEIIYGWKSLSEIYKCKKVHPYRFIMGIWLSVRECSEKHSSSTNKRHCWYGIDSPGWGCKFINLIFRDPQGPGNYKTSNKYWYNFGSFDENDQWIINKNYLLERLAAEIEEKGIDTCPYFDFEKVKKAVQYLPESVEIDNLNFKIYYITEYENGEKIQKAVNIRHIKVDTSPPDLRRMIEDQDYLISKISIN
jgi:hypothetical protein